MARSKLDADMEASRSDPAWQVEADKAAQSGKTIHHTKASTFADIADLKAFQKCKARKPTPTDLECFKVGDNGIGYWRLGEKNTAQNEIPMCALPPETIIETWGSISKAKDQLVNVKNKENGHSANLIVADTMMHLKNITNGCYIDLNPAAVIALGVKGGEARVVWYAI